jgi:two-component system OmpR family sensor kinase
MVATMIRNLLDNAVRFTPQGGRVDVGVYREGNEAVVQIEDTGPGIPSGDIDRIFEPFFRGGRPAEDGTGLGLSIVKRIVDQLGGQLCWRIFPTDP